MVKPERILNDTLDPVIHDVIKSTFVHSCHGLEKAVRLFYSVLKKVSSKHQSKDL